MFKGKAVIVGDGAVGSTTAYTLMLGGLFKEIVLIDVNKKKAEGDALDMSHGVSLVKPVVVTAGDYSDCSNADIIIITAGIPQKEGQTRLDLLKENVELFKKIIESIMRYAPNDVILMTVSNPVDILTYVTYRLSGLKKNQVLGSGTVLDTSRLRYMISKKTGIDARNCHTYIIGEHGDSEVAAWSVTNIGGMTMHEFCKYTGKCDLNDLDKMYQDVKNAAYDIISKKGATYYAIAVAVSRICEAIVGDENSILTVSGIFEGEYGIRDVALSVPTMVGKGGVERIYEVPFGKEEIKGLHDSAVTLSELLRQIGM